MTKLYNISTWQEQSWWNTGGTRDKKIYLNPDDGELYYFKQSFKKGKRDYKFEFWSEIIASELGLLLGFDILPYDIAERDGVLGCISKSMINPDSEELIEGGKYLQAFDNTFVPEDVKSRNQYNFDLIVNALVAFKKEKHIKDLIETIVFDAFIGNSDRHQENWAIINIHSRMSESNSQIEKEITKGNSELFPNWLVKIAKKTFTREGKIRPEFQSVKLMSPKETRFAPIYDSGCSFGRELDDQQIIKMLNDEKQIHKYISKGFAEIHWVNSKLTHFELLKNILEMEGFKEMALKPMERMINLFDDKKVEEIIFNIDSPLNEIKSPNFLPNERKEVTLKLVTLRINKLEEIYSQYK